ncbi:hypothetical protein VRB67_13990 [Pseudomonas trivialis]|uniref:hypothetical protein n=1 Tax=Pseudomonas trivialis TaxID=200450 RepID=UPI0030CD0B42
MEQRLERGMVELAQRYASQFAAARAKRIFHQSMSASNVTLEGAWIDLAGATVFSNAMWWDGFNIGRFMNEYSPVMESIQDMCFYLSKYRVVSIDSSNSMLKASVAAFTHEYENRLFLYTAMQVGFPLQVIQDMREDIIFIEFSRTLQKVLAHDIFSLMPVPKFSAWEGYEHYVARLYRQLLLQKFTHLPQDLSWFCKDKVLMARLIEAYDQLVEQVIVKAEVANFGVRHLIAFMAINTTRLNRVGASLLNIREKITEVRVDSSRNTDVFSYSTLFESALLEAELAYKDSTSFDTLLWKTGEVTIYFDGLSGCFAAADNETGNKIMLSKFVDLSKQVKCGSDLLVFYDDIKELLP